jgi:hypothetical protein
MRSLAAAAVAAVGLVAAGYAQAEPARVAAAFTHEGWQGHVLFTGGKFLQCQMSMSAINNYDLVLSVDRPGELRLGLRSQKLDVGWSMLFQQKFGLRIQIDQGPVLTKAFEAKSPTAISTSLSGTDWDKRLRGGKLLRINTGSRVRLFHLVGIDKAMNLLHACAAKHRGA